MYVLYTCTDCLVDEMWEQDSIGLKYCESCGSEMTGKKAEIKEGLEYMEEDEW